MNGPTHPSVYPQIRGDLLSKVNLFRWIAEFARASDIGHGYYLEFGVLNGEGMIAAYRQLRGVVTHMYGFDSFQGLPAFEEPDRSGMHLMPVFQEGNYASLSPEQVHSTIVSCCRIPPDNLALVPGEFSKTLPVFDKRQLQDKGFPVCAYVDCDLYSSSKDVFSFLTDIVQTGTWLLLDDYWCYRGHPGFGQRKALDEWVRDNGRVGVSEYGNFGGFGKAFIVYER